jgi:hypothetical protein
MDNKHMISNIQRHHVEYMLNWCFETFGTSKYYPFLKLRVFVKDQVKEDFGYLDSHKCLININVKTHKTLVALCDTVIHEFTHYLQDPNLYEKFERIYKYDNHPHEIQADKTAKKWRFKLKKDFLNIYG